MKRQVRYATKRPGIEEWDMERQVRSVFVEYDMMVRSVERQVRISEIMPGRIWIDDVG